MLTGHSAAAEAICGTAVPPAQLPVRGGLCGLMAHGGPGGTNLVGEMNTFYASLSLLLSPEPSGSLDVVTLGLISCEGLHMLDRGRPRAPPTLVDDETAGTRSTSSSLSPSSPTLLLESYLRPADGGWVEPHTQK